MPQLSGLYAIADADACEGRALAVPQVVRAMTQSSSPPRVLQVRAKGRSDEDYLAWLREARALTEGKDILLFANDRADLASLAGCDGVHVGQSDLPLGEVRRLFPALLVGVSTHDPEQFESALGQKPDYLALGPLFETASKRNPEPTVGEEGLKKLAPLARAAGVPLVGIGGLTAQRVSLIREQVQLVAVISALLPEAGAPLDATVDALCQRFVRALGSR